MRCVNCGAKRKGNPERFSLRCPSCGHRVAATASADRVTDYAIAAAVRRVSGNGRFYFLPDHVGYELSRRGLDRRRRARLFAWIGMAAIGLGLLLPLGWLSWAGVFAGAVLLTLWLRRNARIPKQPFLVSHRFLEINQSPHIALAAERPEVEPGPAVRELLETTTQVLICQRSQYVDFLVANDFHLHQACPVLGPEHYPRTLFPGLMERLRQQGNPSAYVLHDLTPAGQALTRRVREAPEWFGNCPDAKVFNIGLVPALHDDIGPERPLAEIPGAGSGTAGGKIARGSGIELTAVRPRTFMRGLEQSLVAGAPLALLAEEKGKTGNRDSE